MRLFTAIILPSNIISKIVNFQQQIEKNIIYTSKKIPAQNLHVTLNFIGQINNSHLQEIIEALKLIPNNSYEIIFDNIEFLHRGQDGLIWISGSHNDQLSKLKRAIDNALSLNDQGDDFRPHVTLFRIKKPKPLALFKNAVADVKFTPIKMAGRGFSLMQSHLTPSGSSYQELARFDKSY